MIVWYSSKTGVNVVVTIAIPLDYNMMLKWAVWICKLQCLFAWCGLTPLSTIFQLYRDGQFYWWRKSLTNFHT
jgi:hypothetical protein